MLFEVLRIDQKEVEIRQMITDIYYLLMTINLLLCLHNSTKDETINSYYVSITADKV